jgi:hypothetical protein
LLSTAGIAHGGGVQPIAVEIAATSTSAEHSLQARRTKVTFPGGFVITNPGGTRVKFPGGFVIANPGGTVVKYPGGFINIPHGVITFPGGSVNFG